MSSLLKIVSVIVSSFLCATFAVGAEIQINVNDYNIYKGDLDGDGDNDLYFSQKPFFIILHGDIATPLLIAGSKNYAVYNNDGVNSNAVLFNISTELLALRIAAGWYTLAVRDVDFFIGSDGKSVSVPNNTAGSGGASVTTTFAYDALGRLTSVTDPVNGNRGYNYDAAGNRIKVKGPDFVAPSNPSALIVQAVTGSSALISWTASTDNADISNYEYSLNGGAWIVNASTTVNVTGLAPVTNYLFAVRAKDEANNISGATSISFKTTLNAPTGLQCWENFGPGAWKGKWNAVAGAHHYVFKAVNTSEVSISGTDTGNTPVQQSTKPCSWVKACDANNNCGPQTYF